MEQQVKNCGCEDLWWVIDDAQICLVAVDKIDDKQPCPGSNASGC